jgi:hypothetical protein
VFQEGEVHLFSDKKIFLDYVRNTEIFVFISSGYISICIIDYFTLPACQRKHSYTDYISFTECGVSTDMNKYVTRGFPTCN